MMNNENAKPTIQQLQQLQNQGGNTGNDNINNAVISPPVLYSSKPPTVLVNSWNETRQARELLDQCRAELSAERDRAEGLERRVATLEEANAVLRAHLDAFEMENQLPPGWERIFSDSQRRYFYSHAATQTSQWHYPTASEARDPGIAKMRVDQNTRDAQTRRLS